MRFTKQRNVDMTTFNKLRQDILDSLSAHCEDNYLLIYDDVQAGKYV
jgi:hypothetical protein